jgi:hypothetical protein
MPSALASAIESSILKPRIITERVKLPLDDDTKDKPQNNQKS